MQVSFTEKKKAVSWLYLMSRDIGENLWVHIFDIDCSLQLYPCRLILEKAMVVLDYS